MTPRSTASPLAPTLPSADTSASELYDGQADRWVRRRARSLSDFTARRQLGTLCGDISGARVIDLGCGEGYCARLLRAMGASWIDAIDISAGMIERARAQETAQPLGGLTYHVGSVTDLGTFAESSFDLAVGIFVYNYLTVEEMHRSMAAARRVLRPGGRFVFTVPHPSFAFIRKERTAPFFFDVRGSGYFSGRDRCFPGRIWTQDGTPLEVQLRHKTLEDYFEGLASAGFERLPKIRELRVTAELEAEDPAFFNPVADTPLHLAMMVER